jgi:uncharacterized RDD family membrane protein YckC
MSAVPSARPNPRPAATANPYAPPRARVRDVAGPRTATVLAERSARLGAAIVDGLIFGAMVYVPLIVGMLFLRVDAETGTAAGMEFLMIGSGLALVGFIAWLWMTLRQMKDTGQSLAKKYFNIKVVLSDGSPASLGTLIWKRNVVTWLLSIIPLYGLIEILFIFGEQRQCLHDRIADTIVVEA